jgi:1-acyl-sn-glycerol-3-phosphate acyltransferase
MFFFSQNIKSQIDLMFGSFKGVKKFFFGSRLFRRFFSRIMRFAINSKYLDSFLKKDTIENLYRNLLADLNIAINVSDEDLDKIPTNGPLIVIANHISSPMDWMIISQVLSMRLKKRAYVVTTSSSALINDGTMMYIDQGKSFYKKCLEKLWNEHPVAIFPTGGIERIFTFDKYWKDTHEFKPGFLRIAQKSGAAILPIYIDLKAHLLKHILLYINCFLGVLFGTRELKLYRNRKINVRIGDAVPNNIVINQSTDEKQMKEYRRMVYNLGQKSLTD